MFTFIGLLVGLFNGGFFGGVLGFIIGSFIDRMVFKKKVYREKHHYNQDDFAEIILILSAAVMKADGDLKTSELNYIKSYLTQKFSIDKAQSLLLKFKDTLSKNYDIQEVCADLQANASIHEKLYILQFLFGLAAADGSFTQSEVLLIQQISDFMGVSRSNFESIKSMYIFFGQGGYQSYGGGYQSYGGSGGYQYAPTYNLDNDYKILEINSSATDDEVKKAYRTLAKQHHPDKVNHLGEEIRKDAEVKFTKLNEAYERIKKSRGMK